MANTALLLRDAVESLTHQLTLAAAREDAVCVILQSVKRFYGRHFPPQNFRQTPRRAHQEQIHGE
ncbi:hypothetical protein SAMN00790413_04436 [Deinococcus hopiensis KR-140]|uniref:Uncharacterized protein n=1 Tax=Deinococcus hopiensis KR-140 TaxID=695939 RepID=A0A1W1UQT8_9DEIO|nr:hypothetical protein SAMN00790413_04436 [Deinococcus hopiensis KR-140]